ncbi:MAG: hypothetical protein LLG13_03500 [Bacteroidales bacterium]|nr:hypothetical protein [Bacteroidales bacterium]
MKTENRKNPLRKIVSTVIFAALFNTTNLFADELLIGVATADITPKLPVALDGQFHLRIARTIETPLTANVVALESRDGNRFLDLAIMVSCDLVGIPREVLKSVRDEVKKQLPEIDVNKIFLNAIHTHTAPVMENGINSSFRYEIPKDSVLQPEEYDEFFVQRVSESIVKAWKNRSPGSVSWGMSHAALAYQRRTVYADGSAVMYGKTNTPEFRNMEGIEDHDVNVLFFWNRNGKLIAMSIDAPCTAQEVENRYAVNADYYHPVREKLKQRFGSDLVVLGWIGAAGDQSPRPLYRQAAEARMIKLRNLTRLDEITRRLVTAVEEVYETVEQDRYSDVKLVHKAEMLTLPKRIITEKEYEISKDEQEKAAGLIAADPKAAAQQLARMTWNRDVVRRYESQKTNKNATIDSEVHVLRIGDVVVCTNEFELFTDYGLRIEAQSNALQTFVIQLTGSGSYLPTEKAVKGGGYSAVAQSSIVGPDGGQILVDRTVKLINEMFPETK